MTFHRWSSQRPHLVRVYRYGDSSAFNVDYKSWKEGKRKYLLSSPFKWFDPRLIIDTEGFFKDFFEDSLHASRCEAAVEKMKYDGYERLIPLLKTAARGKALIMMMVPCHAAARI